MSWRHLTPPIQMLPMLQNVATTFDNMFMMNDFRLWRADFTEVDYGRIYPQGVRLEMLGARDNIAKISRCKYSAMTSCYVVDPLNDGPSDKKWVYIVESHLGAKIYFVLTEAELTIVKICYQQIIQKYTLRKINAPNRRTMILRIENEVCAFL